MVADWVQSTKESKVESQEESTKGIAETAQLGLTTIQGMEPADQYAYLKTKIKTREAALRAKDVELHLRDALLQSKDAVIEAKNAVIHAVDAEMQRLQAELAAANRIRNKKRGLLALSGLNARYGSENRNVHPNPADSALAPLLAQQPQVHFIHLVPPFLLLCHPISSDHHPPPLLRCRRALTRRSVCSRQGSMQLQQSNCCRPLAWGICPHAHSWRGCSSGAERELPRI